MAIETRASRSNDRSKLVPECFFLPFFCRVDVCFLTCFWPKKLQSRSDTTNTSPKTTTICLIAARTVVPLTPEEPLALVVGIALICFVMFAGLLVLIMWRSRIMTNGVAVLTNAILPTCNNGKSYSQT